MDKRKMAHSLIGVTWALLSSGTWACGGEARPPTLTNQDVTNLPPGDATVTTFSGTYVVQSASIVACYCRTGSCSTFQAQTGGMVTYVQQAGQLSQVDTNGATVATGGVDQDGKFWLGGTSQVLGGTSYDRVDGMFVLAGGSPSSANITTDSTATAGAPLGFDCDVSAAAVLRFQN